VAQRGHDLPQQEEQATALIIRAQQGDSIGTALLTCSRRQRQCARNRLGNVPWIDDVAQETLVTVPRRDGP
jgi:DNA-directed RNA polymerase specialized sigma24 family protein